MLLQLLKSYSHSPVGDVGDGEHMRGHLVSFLPLVDFDDLLGVDGQSLVGVDHHTEEPGVGLSEQIHSLV